VAVAAREARLEAEARRRACVALRAKLSRDTAGRCRLKGLDTRLESAGCHQRLKHVCDDTAFKLCFQALLYSFAFKLCLKALPSSFAFKFTLRRYHTGTNLTAAACEVGRCRLPVSIPVLNPPTRTSQVSALEIITS